MVKGMVADDKKESYGRTSLKMTRSMSEDIGLDVKKVLEDIDNQQVSLTHIQWQEFVSYIWNDEIWRMALNKAIRKCKIAEIDLNTNKEFLEIISEMSPNELKNEFTKTHPIARLSLMLIPRKKPPKPEKPRMVEELWP